MTQPTPENAVSTAGPDACGQPPTTLETGPTQTILHLRELPLFERREALETLLTNEFKSTLLMTDVDELPLDASFFDLGLTSLRLSEIKQGLEARLGCGINANVLFNRPTVAQLMAHLTDDVLADLFTAGAELGDGQLVSTNTHPADGTKTGTASTKTGTDGTKTGTATEQLWDSVLDGLYRA